MSSTPALHAVPIANVPLAAARLVWSEHVYVIAFIAALVVALALPEWRLQNSVLRHLPLLLTLPAVVLSYVGGRLTTPMHSIGYRDSLFRLFWPLLLLALIVLTGSLHARWVDGVQATFANVGTYMLMTPIATVMVTSSHSPLKLVDRLLTWLLIGAFTMCGGLIYYFGVREMFHEQIFLLLPLSAFCILAARKALIGWLGGLFILSMAILSMKNTSYIIALMILGYLSVLLWLPHVNRAKSTKQLLGHYITAVVLLATAVAIAWVISQREALLPTGNVAYRSHTYLLAWQQFQASPLWGTLFNAESIREFTLYTIGIAGNRLPSHSDLMDLLANGGALGIGLWLLSYFKIFRLAYQRLLAPSLVREPFAAHGHTLALISLAGIVTYTFNPVLLQPALAYLLWTCLGLLVGLALRVDSGRRVAQR